MAGNEIIRKLSANKAVFKYLLSELSEEEFMWKAAPDKWSLLEVICHLYDEEREDFRARTNHILEKPEEPLPPINPPAWVSERNYKGQNYDLTLQNFLNERENSVKWLNSLSSPDWDNAYDHPEFGRMSAGMILANWLAHDLLHIRQILRIQYGFLKFSNDEDLSYAGSW